MRTVTKKRRLSGENLSRRWRRKPKNPQKSRPRRA